MNNTTAADIPNVKYSIVFDFEKNFNNVEKHLWMVNNWKSSFLYSAIYIMVIFLGRRIMKNRPRFELRGVLFLWSLSLAIFSMIGTWRFFPEMLTVLRDHGFYHSCCIPSFFEHNKVSACWTWWFAQSKLLELGDTIFIVLRKQPLMFLHWYHHVTVLSYVWYACAGYTATGRWFVAMNYTVHSFMYAHYALRALKIRIPKPISMLITIGQLMQMVVGCYVNIYVYNTKSAGIYCGVSYENVRVSLLMYFSYFLLFLQFFYKAYVDKKARTAANLTFSREGNLKKVD